MKKLPTIYAALNVITLYSCVARLAETLESKLCTRLLADTAVITRVDVARRTGIDADTRPKLTAKISLLSADDELTDTSWDWNRGQYI